MAPVKPGRTGTWIMLAILAVFLALAFAFLYVGWGSTNDAADHQVQQMSTSGYVAMTLGIIVTLALGVGLMTLVFYSNRRGHDQDANIDHRK